MDRKPLAGKASCSWRQWSNTQGSRIIQRAMRPGLSPALSFRLRRVRRRLEMQARRERTWVTVAAVYPDGL